MAIKRTAFVARTAHDLNHVNHLVLPQFGVVELRVRVDECTSQLWVSRLRPPRAPASRPQ